VTEVFKAAGRPERKSILRLRLLSLGQIRAQIGRAKIVGVPVQPFLNFSQQCRPHGHAVLNLLA
jgi:hypothetical protein